MNKTFCVIGGDMRFNRLVNKLASNGNLVYALGLSNDIEVSEYVRMESLANALKIADVVILPLPVTNDGVFLNAKGNILLTDLFPLISKIATVFGGRVDEKTKKLAHDNKIKIIDYFDREETKIRNAVPTSEGAVEIAMQEMQKTLFSSKCLVTGWGRIAKVLAPLLKSMGADVDITARKYTDLTWAEIQGFGTFHISKLSEKASHYDVIFNTPPTLLFDENILKTLNKTLVIDLSSKPGGVDFETAEKLGVKTIWALSLPGKVAPDTAGDIILSTILNILNERGEMNG